MIIDHTFFTFTAYRTLSNRIPMATIEVNQVELHYHEVGTGKETLVFSHGYLMNHTMFEQQIAVFKDHFRCIAFDHRGHSQSEVTQSGYDLDNLVTDAIGLIEGLNLGPVHFVGMSTGGFVGMRIALRRPDLLRSLVLMDTSAEAESPKTLKKYHLLLWVLRYIGYFPVIGQVVPLLFHRSFLKNKTHRATVKQWRNIITSQNRPAMVAFGKGIFARTNILEQLSTVTIPTAVIIGEHDKATRPIHSERMAATIPNALYTVIPDAGHGAAIEKPEEVTEAMRQLYTSIGVLE